MKSVHLFAKCLLLYLLFASCSTKKEPLWYLDTQQLWKDYRQAVEDARTAEPTEISTKLVTITVPGDNPRMEWITEEDTPWILVGSLLPPSIASRFTSGATTLATEELTWVTVPFDLEEHMRAATTCSDSLECRVRMLQMLGLPPDDGSDRIVFFYVEPSNLRRPTYHPTIDDATTTLTFAEDAPEHYREWFAGNADFSYNSSTPYPWTRLGYTYDWHKDAGNVQGPSEFIVHPGARMRVKQVTGIWTWYHGIK